MTEVLRKDLVEKSSDRRITEEEEARALTVIKMFERNLAPLTNSQNAEVSGENAKIEEKVWLVGNRCVAPYYVDGLWYPGEITGLDRITGQAEVTFDGYGNTEMVKIADLIGEEEYVPDEGGDVELEEEGGYEDDNDLEEEEEEGEGDGEEEYEDPNLIYQAPSLNKKPKRNEKDFTAIKDSPNAEQRPSTSGAAFNAPIPSIAPPPPPSLFRDGGLPVPPNGDGALNAMLMSWYMNGYHTGYYQAIKDMESQQQHQHQGKRKK